MKNTTVQQLARKTNLNAQNVNKRDESKKNAKSSEVNVAK
jgi:hypothetical protein